VLALAPGAGAAYVRVAVATLYTAPGKALLPADPRSWGALTTPQRLALVGRVETQALLGEQVLVLARSGAWDRVVVPDQPTPRDRRGYPGWVLASQLQPGPPRVPPTPVLPQTGADVVRLARTVLGTRYLWGGTSPFGFDCSGLAWWLYRAHGITIPRDADAQAAGGTAVAAAALRPGDLLFYGSPHVGHVGVYAGSGTMIESPDSAGSVRVTPVRRGWVAARRYVSGA
jgi:cell wall-associated NlpC family hydrolase